MASVSRESTHDEVCIGRPVPTSSNLFVDSIPLRRMAVAGTSTIIADDGNKMVLQSWTLRMYTPRIGSRLQQPISVSATLPQSGVPGERI
jgi:hypothetical protein